MTKFNASVTESPSCDYAEFAEMTEEQFAAICASQRKRYGKVLVTDDDGNTTWREMTPNEIVKRALGTLLAGLRQNVIDDATESAKADAEAAIKAAAPDWTVGKA